MEVRLKFSLFFMMRNRSAQIVVFTVKTDNLMAYVTRNIFIFLRHRSDRPLNELVTSLPAKQEITSSILGSAVGFSVLENVVFLCSLQMFCSVLSSQNTYARIWSQVRGGSRTVFVLLE